MSRTGRPPAIAADHYPMLVKLAQANMFATAPATIGFVVMPTRWVVERTHAWNERARRLIMHHDRLFAVSEAWVWLAEARMLARRLTT